MAYKGQTGRAMSRNRKKLPPEPFPDYLYRATFCGEPQSLTRSHSTYSASRRQTNYLAVLSKRFDYTPPKQTCCSNQAKALIRLLDEQSERETP